MKKRIFTLCLLGIFTLSAYGCGKSSSDSATAESSSSQTDVEELTEAITDSADSESQTEPVTTVPDIDYEAEYSDILDTFYEYLLNPDEYEDMEDGMTGVFEARMEQEPADVLCTIGYAFEDLSGDGVPELLIGSVDDKETSEGAILYNIYTLENNEPKLVAEGWARSRISLMDNGNLYTEGSSGAMYSIFGTYSFNEDASLKCNDYYFSYEIDDDVNNIGFFYNNTGVYDKAESTQLDIATFEDFNKLSDELREHCVKVKFKILKEYMPVTKGKFGAKLTGEWVYNDNDIPEDAVEFDCEDTETNQQIMFKTSKDITDVKILKISLTDAADEGEFAFALDEELFSTESLSADSALIVKNIAFMGDAPEYAISYTDTDGTEKTKSFSISGMDGSIVLDDDVDEMINKN